MTAQQNINRYWTGRADSYDAHQVRQIGNPEIRQGWTDVWRRVLPAPPARVLDVGTGTGHVSLLLAGLGYDVTGIDLAEGMLAKAKEKAAELPDPPDLRLGDAVAPDFPAASFDVVTSRYVLWTLRTPLTAARNWRGLLAPGGLLAAVDSTWFPNGIQGTSMGELYDQDVRSLLPLAEATGIGASADIVRAAGFADVTVTPLPEILDLDRRHGVADGHEVRMQFLITGRAV
ncbi:class I SAM-dependent methyltransferase [Actinophytocola algeriensis]|uniref:SAM-dependent methyltransferase n=1 Tax=Actinophytocola algeriensis TaxID=1768010 RepID=A0A7W7VGL2_9PSEU|nr:class I SAM-dependent methyltransferase [Actinophytocola algeriensis]MBB4909180.1 SAM-dependent methyltransferase [Actinophytocola algeriensis]MBE1474432.1 SAM-dependent methyltransferase [Actinophytocola algeriensis]